MTEKIALKDVLTEPVELMESAPGEHKEKPPLSIHESMLKRYGYKLFRICSGGRRLHLHPKHFLDGEPERVVVNLAVYFNAGVVDEDGWLVFYDSLGRYGS
jgi:hypothetical protein